MQEREGRESGLPLTYRLIDADRLGFGVDDLPELLAWAQPARLRRAQRHPPVQAGGRPAARRALRGRRRPRRGQHRGVPRRADARPQHRLVGLRPGVPPGAARTPCRTAVVLVGAGGAGRRGRLRPAASRAPRTWRCSTPTGTGPTPARSGSPKRFGDDRVSVATTSSGRSPTRRASSTPPRSACSATPGCPCPGGWSAPELWVSDVVYFPLETELVALARARGCRVVPGGGMAVHQAVGRLRVLHRPGRRTPDRMARHFEELTGADAQGDRHRLAQRPCCRTSCRRSRPPGFDGVEIFDNDLVACPAGAPRGRRPVRRPGPGDRPVPAGARRRGRGAGAVRRGRCTGCGPSSRAAELGAHGGAGLLARRGRPSTTSTCSPSSCTRSATRPPSTA